MSAVTLGAWSSELIPEGVYVYDAWTQWDRDGACPVGGGGGGGDHGGSGGSATITIVNDGIGGQIQEVFISPSSSDDWGPDLLSGFIVEGSEQTITTFYCDMNVDLMAYSYDMTVDPYVTSSFDNYVECGKSYSWNAGWKGYGTTGANISNNLKIYEKQIP